MDIITFPIMWILTWSRVRQVNDFSVHEHSLALAERLFFMLMDMDKRRPFLWTPPETSAVNKQKHVVYIILYICNTGIRRCLRLKFKV